MNPSSKTHSRAARVLGAGFALLVLAVAASPAPLAAQSACTLASTPSSFEPNPPGAQRTTMQGSYSSSLVLYRTSAGANRMMMNETFGYSVLDLSNPVNPTALLYDDFRTDPSNTNTNPLQQHGDGQSAIQTFGVSPDGQRATFSVNGPFDPPWHTIGARNYGGEGFGLWGDFAPNRALGTVVQHVNGRYIAYAIHGSINMTAADITTLPSALASYKSCTPGTSCQAFDSTGFPQAYSSPLYLAGNYLVYETGTYQNTSITVIDASNPGPAGSITSAYKSLTIPYGTSNSTYYPMNFTVALDPGDSTKLWILVENLAAPGDKSPSYGLVAVTKDGGGNLTATAAPGPYTIPAAGGETWGTAGGGSSLVAVNGTLFAVMWAQRSLPSAQTGFYATTVSAWSAGAPVGLPFQPVSASGFQLPATHASALAGSGTSAYQYFPTGTSAFVVPLTCAPVNPKATSTITVTNASITGNPTISNGGTAWIGDQVTVTPNVVPPPSQTPLGGTGWGLAGWNIDVDFHAGAFAEDAAPQMPQIKLPNNAQVLPANSPPTAFIIYGVCDPTYTGVSVNPFTGAGCWTSVTSNGAYTASGQPDFSASAPVAKPLVIAMEANNQYGSSGLATFTINWQVPAAKVASTQILSGAPMVDASDGHPTQTAYKWYFGDSPTTLSLAGSPDASCLPTTPGVGTHYYWLTTTYANGFSTPDYVNDGNHAIAFTISNFVPAFTVGGSATDPITAVINTSVDVVNNSQRGSGITATYQYSLCALPCADNYRPLNIPDSSGALSSITLPDAVGTYALKIQANYTGTATGTAYWPDPAGTNYFTINAVNIPVTSVQSINPNPVPAGSSVTLTCSANGGVPPYTAWAWYSNGSQVSTQNPYTFTATNPGTTDVNYQVTCTATDTNSQTSQQSPPQTLTILHSVKPVVSASVNPTQIVGGQSATFSCGATGGTGTGYTYQWFASVGGILSRLSNYTVSIPNTSGSTITEQLWCSVTDSAGATGTSPSPATLTVTSSTSGPPSGSLTVSASVSPNPVSTGQPAVFSCSASGGSGSYSYAWYVAGVGNAISAQQNYTYTPSSPGSLSLACSVTDRSTQSTGQSSVNLSIVNAGPSCPSVDFKVYASDGTQLQVSSGPLGITIPMSASLGDNLAFSITVGANSPQFDWNFGDGSPHLTGLASDPAVTFARHGYTSGGNFTATLKGICSDGTFSGTGMSYPIKVDGPAGQFSAAYDDASPITYTQVTAFKNIVFTSLDSPSLVDAGSYVWDFGDGATTNGSSTATHAYVPGTWTAKLTLTKNGFPVSTTLALTVPAPPEPPKWVVPGMAYVLGQVAGTTWQSDVTIMNPSALSAKYSVAFLDARNPVTDYSQLTWTPITVDPLGVIDSGNLLAGPPFNQPLGAYGALMVRGDVAPLPPVITARTFNNGDPTKGTFGLSVPQSSVSAGVSTQAAAAASVLVGLRQNATAYTNIGLVNLHNDWATVELDFYDGASADLGTLTVQINPYQAYQINRALQDPRFVPAAGYSGSSDLYSVLVKVTEGTGVYPYATVIDAGTTDPIVVTPTASPSNSYRIPGIVRLTGANGELWRSRVTIANPSTASRKVHLVFYYEACIAGGCSSLNSTAGDVNFAPGQTQSWDDFVNIWLLYKGFITVSDTTSYQNTFLDVSPGDADSDPLVVLGETYNATPAGHVGLQIPAYTPVDGASSTGAYKRLALTGLASSATNRTNLSLFVIAGSTGKWATVHVLSPQGTELRSLAVPIDGSTVPNATLFGGLPGDLSRLSIVIDNIDAGVTVGGYATIIDNTSGDSTFVRATPVP